MKVSNNRENLKKWYAQNKNPMFYPLISNLLYLLTKKRGALKIKLAVLFFALVFKSFYILSQSNPMTFDYLTTDDGQSTTRVRGVFRDSKSYLLFSLKPDLINMMIAILQNTDKIKLKKEQLVVMIQNKES